MLAQLPNTTPDGLGTWLIGAVAVLFILDLLMRVWQGARELTKKPEPPPSPQPAERLVTRGELDGQTQAITSQIAKVEGELRREIQRVEDNGRSRSHELANHLQVLTNKLHELKPDMLKEVAALLLPLTGKVDRLTVAIAKLETKITGETSMLGKEV